MKMDFVFIVLVLFFPQTLPLPPLFQYEIFSALKISQENSHSIIQEMPVCPGWQ